MKVLDAFFFRPVPALELARFRFFFLVGLALVVVRFYAISVVPTLAAFAAGQNAHVPIPLFQWLGFTAVPDHFWMAPLAAALVLAFLLAAFGIGARLALAFAAPAFVLLMGSQMSLDPFTASGGAGRNVSLAITLLFLLICVPGIGEVRGRALWRKQSGGMIPAWPLQLVKISVVLVFFAAGWAKARHGLAWVEGSTLQSHLLFVNSGLAQGHGLGLANELWLCRAFSFLVVVCELLAPLVLFSRRLELPFVAAALVFHAANLFFLGITGFLSCFALAYFVFFDLARQEKVWNFLRRVR